MPDSVQSGSDGQTELREADERFMEQALALAATGRGRTHPNPMVGAVLVVAGDVVGKGAHLAAGTAHAEVVALREAGARARGATLYCTLEPCSHYGRTPPCADALIAAGVHRVVVAMRDPNPQVDGRGLRRLMDAGVEVEVMSGPLARRAAELNAAFVKSMRTGLPLVTYKAAVSLDGKVAAAAGEPGRISCTESRRLVHEWRAQADAVMVGAGTVRRDDPLLTVRDVPGRQPARVVVTASGQLPAESRLFSQPQGGTVVVLARQMDAALRQRLGSAGVEVLDLGATLADGLRLLVARGHLEILCEGGPTFAAALLAEGLIDRVALFVAPLFIGRGAPDVLASQAVHSVQAALRLTEVQWRQVGRDMLVEGRVQTAIWDEDAVPAAQSGGMG